ncbi:MAG: nucleotidyltransferase family protein [Oscillospiraceae bacterium]|nr:nucleotidyltransferase family protein [Oscillospiraceae bacterium]
MKTIGVICEYNPLHAGHKKQLDTIRTLCGEDTAIVCLMSGNYVQRGAPAIIDKSLRAKAAILAGADLVLELPIPYALSSAEGFAAGGVEILSGFCDGLCFGAESDDKEALLKIARALLSDSFPPLLRRELDTGKSFPAARQAALEAIHLDGALLTSPNNILAVEYCKAILSRDCTMEPIPILRGGNYHDSKADLENPSATSIRALMLESRYWKSYVPGGAVEVFEHAPLHTLAAGERAILARLRTMTDAEFEALPYGSEGLWRKFMHNCRSFATLDEILEATKSKRYTRTRLDRMMLCAFLGLTAEDLSSPVPYTRILAFNDRGRSVLKEARNHGIFLNAGESADGPYAQNESRMGDLYGLFAVDGPEAPGIEEKRRVYYHKEN